MDERHTQGSRMSLGEYLAFEAHSDIRHEFVGGEVYALPGASLRHARIALNIGVHLRPAARARGCAVVLSDVKVRVAPDRIYYPDAMVACGEAMEVDLIVDAPSLIVEVSSPTSRATDRREKMDAYLRLPSLEMYLIVEQRRRQVIAYARDVTGAWLRDEVGGSGVVVLPFLNSSIALDDIYEDITLPPLSVGEEWGEAD